MVELDMGDITRACVGYGVIKSIDTLLGENFMEWRFLLPGQRELYVFGERYCRT